MLLIQVTVRNQIARNPDFSNLPLTQTKRRFPSSVEHCYFTPATSRTTRFFEPIFVSLGAPKNRDSALHASCYASVEIFKSTANRFVLQFYGKCNWKYGQIRLLCSL